LRSSLASAAVVGIVIGFVAILALMRPHLRRETVLPMARTAGPASGVGATAGASPAVPEPTASEALFERNRSMPSDPDLANEYDHINDEYFANILPAPQTRWESGLARLGPAIAEHFVVEGLTDGRIILLNPDVEHDADQRRRALCHEMVHIAVWRQDTGHGPVFQERLRELSLRGAFKGIAATDEERDAMAASLRQKRSGLEVEERALREDRESLDRTSQAAVDAFNARVRRQQAAAAEYNRLVAQYNLMISYPDGLARERLQLRADGTSPDER
jgi:hypothetical protein